MFSIFKRKTKQVNPLEQGWLTGMIDIHCHLLPAVDDGSKSIEETLSLIDLLEEIGVKQHILTPHIMEEYPSNDAIFLRARFEELLAAITPDKASRLRLAAEYMLDAAFLDRLAEPLLTLGDRHILVETSYMAPPIGLMGLLADLRFKGLSPVLAHPERYLYMEEKDYVAIKKQGVMFQLNLFSLFGAYNSSASEKAYALLEAGYYDLIGTDIHHLQPIARLLSEASLPPDLEGKIKSLVENNNRLFS